MSLARLRLPQIISPPVPHALILRTIGASLAQVYAQDIEAPTLPRLRRATEQLRNL